MVERIIQWCVVNRVLVITLSLAVAGWGFWAIPRTPLDAVPDTSDVQVVVATDWPGRSPDLIEDQITYPIGSALVSAPRVQAVRGVTEFGVSFVSVSFRLTMSPLTPLNTNKSASPRGLRKFPTRVSLGLIERATVK